MDIVLTIGTVIIAGLIFFWLLKVVKSTLKTAFLVGLFLLGLYLAFGIGPMQVLETMQGWLPDFVQPPESTPTQGNFN